MKPIRKRLLIHSATLRQKTGHTDSWQNNDYNDISLTRVRFEPSNKLVQTPENQETQLLGILFYDSVNSRPLNTTFNPDDLLVFNGRTYTITVVEELYDDEKLHHYEIGLI